MSKPPTWIVLRTPYLPFSVRVDRRVPRVLLLALLATLAVMVVNIGVGDYPIAPLDVIKSVLHLPPASADHDFIVNTLRLPRMLVAALVGLALGVSGTILQGLTRNPLADPDILGISTGAGLAAVSLIVVFQGAPASLLPWAAFGGAAGMALLIYLLAWQGGDSPLRLILVGIGLGAAAGALTTLAITFGDAFEIGRAHV